MPVPAVRVVHQIRGRVRFELPPSMLTARGRAGIEKELNAQPEIVSVRINPRGRTVVIRHTPGIGSRRLRNLIERARPRDPAERTHPGRPGRHVRSLVALSAGGALALIAPPFALPLVGLGSLAIFRRAAIHLRRGNIGVDTLDAAAMTITVLTGQLLTAAILGALVEGGELLRDLTASRSRREIGALMSHEDATCWKLVDGHRAAVKVGSIRAGDRILVAAGDRIPVDATVLRGKALVDERMLTGEPLPATKGRESGVFAMTVVTDGELAIEAGGTAAESRAGRIMTFLEKAPIGETRMADQARRFADRFVVPIIGTAAIVYALTGNPMRAASILIFDLATGIRIAAPTTMLASLIAAAREGILIKGAAAMEKLAAIDTIVFDKTGTLTVGQPAVAGVTTFNGLTEDELLVIAAAADNGLNHPLAAALMAEAKRRRLHVPHRAWADYRIGLGVEAMLDDGRRFLVGNRDFMAERSVKIPRNVNGHGLSEVIVAAGGECIGAIVFTDDPRTDAAGIIQALRARGVSRIALLSGDTQNATRRVAEALGVDEWAARTSPDEKAEFVRRLKARGHRVAVVGDGVNDSVAFALADLSVAMGGGADLARANSDVVLLDDRLELLTRAIDRSRESLGLMNQNLALIAAPNAFGIGGAIAGGVNPAVAALLNNGSAVVAAANGMRPLIARRKPAARRSR